MVVIMAGCPAPRPVISILQCVIGERSCFVCTVMTLPPRRVDDDDKHAALSTLLVSVYVDGKFSQFPLSHQTQRAALATSLLELLSVHDQARRTGTVQSVVFSLLVVVPEIGTSASTNVCDDEDGFPTA